MDDLVDLVARLRAASNDERLSTGMLYREAADEIERLRAENAALREDAERYRWLRDGHNEQAVRHLRWVLGYWNPALNDWEQPVRATWDAAIDAARKAS